MRSPKPLAAAITTRPSYKAAVDEFYGKYLARKGQGNHYFERSLAGLSEQVYGAMWGPSEFRRAR